MSGPERPWTLLLGFKASADEMEDWAQLSQAIPWLAALGERGRATLGEDLRRHGLGAVTCADEQEARRLASQVRGGRVAVEILGGASFSSVGRRVERE